MLELPKTVVATYNCSQCSHRTASSYQLERHIQRNHKNVDAARLFHAIVEPQLFLCVRCDYKSNYHFELYEHCKQMHNLGTTGNNENGTFREEMARYLCGCRRYESDSSLFLVKHHDFCGNEPARRPQQTTEEAGDMESADLRRASARRTVRDVGVIELNMATHDSSGKIAEYNCNHCPYRAKRKSHLKGHMINKHAANEEINWFQCNHCSYRAKQKFSLKAHMLKHAADETINWFQCCHCSYRAKLKINWKTHMLRHAVNEEIDWFQCNHCSYRAKQKSNLKMHMLKHAANEETNWFQCNHCSYRTVQESHFKGHMISRHTADEEINWFQCNHCSYRSKRKFSLKQHMISKHAANEEINWFQCNHCSYRAKHHSYLRKHLLKHAANKE